MKYSIPKCRFCLNFHHSLEFQFSGNFIFDFLVRPDDFTTGPNKTLASSVWQEGIDNDDDTSNDSNVKLRPPDNKLKDNACRGAASAHGSER